MDRCPLFENPGLVDCLVNRSAISFVALNIFVETSEQTENCATLFSIAWRLTLDLHKRLLHWAKVKARCWLQ